MIDILIIFLLVIFLLALLLVAAIAMNRRNHSESENPFIDEDGDHAYYDRSLIEKKEYFRRYPGDKDEVRTLGKLFGFKKSKPDR